ncbi:MAG: DGQHR domain-containing protein [Lachnospiraceae bacterium]|nr:DGQHR domain-containing protein [Lachnospiraceae bacterium]
MKDIYLLEVTQHNTKRYLGTTNAKDLVRLATTVELQTVQDAQRPINVKRLNDIGSFIAAEGTLSTSIVIGTKDDRISVHPANITGIPNLYKMSFPETDAEFADFKDSFDIMDGQHRLFSFLQDYCKLADNVTFDISFEMYIKPTMREKRLIFKNTNEKQEKVASNLLMWFREKLNMLDEKEQIYHPIVVLLNSETCSPLKGRIIMGAEKITGGYKAEQIITILDKSDIKNISVVPLTDDKVLKMVSEYISGWEEAVGSKLIDRDKDLGAFSKISGFRFMTLMLPTFFEQAVNDRANFNKAYVKNKLDKLFSSYGMIPRDLFDKNSDYLKHYGGNPFSGETPITILAKDWSSKLKSLSSESFDPLA